jgi:hypothetical protein
MGTMIGVNMIKTDAFMASTIIANVGYFPSPKDALVHAFAWQT